MDEKHYDIIEDEKKDHEYHNDILAQVVFTGLTLALVFSVFGVILLANFGSNGEQKAYACVPPTATPTALYSHGRELTLSELAFFVSIFPLLVRWEVRVTAPDSLQYNCHRWAILNATTGGPLNMDSDGSGAISYIEYNYYAGQQGYTICDYDDPNRVFLNYKKPKPSEPGGFEITHSVRKYNDELNESKIGQDEIITHKKGKLESTTYGELYKSFKKK